MAAIKLSQGEEKEEDERVNAYEIQDEEDDEDLDEDSDEEDDEYGADGVLVPGSRAGKKGVYDVSAMHEKLEEFSWTEGAEWIQTLALTSTNEALEGVDVHDDLAREMSFYTQALDGVKEAFSRLTDMGIPVVRPADYYAEMVKGDAHMLRVKEKLLQEHKAMEEAEERRKQREAKRYSKEVQAEKTKERTKQKKQDIQDVQKWRKMRQNTNFEGDAGDEFLVGLEGGDGKQKAQGKARVKSFDRSGGNVAGPNQGGLKKRQYRDSKFGYGGKKSLKKQNTAESSADMESFKGSYKDPSFAGVGGPKGKARGGSGGKRVARGGSKRRGKSRR